MRLSSRPFFLPAALSWAALLLTWCNAHAQGVHVVNEVPVDQAEVEENIRKALRKNIDISADETPLSEVMQEIGNALDVNVVLDVPALEQIGLGGDTPVTLELRGISANSALRLILDEMLLTHQIRSEVVLITTKEKADVMLATKVYEVGDLVLTDAESRPLVYSPVAPRPSSADFDMLVETITTTVEPDTWDEVGGPGSIASMEYGGRYVLVISQTTEVYEHIDELLEKLRAVKPHGDAEREVRRESPKEPPIIAQVYPIIGTAAENVGELAELLRETTGADLWNEKEGTMVIGKVNAVLVRHHVQVHEQIVKVLKGLKAIEAGWRGGGSGAPASSRGGGVLSVSP